MPEVAGVPGWGGLPRVVTLKAAVPLVLGVNGFPRGVWKNSDIEKTATAMDPVRSVKTIHGAVLKNRDMWNVALASARSVDAGECPFWLISRWAGRGIVLLIRSCWGYFLTYNSMWFIPVRAR